MAEPAKARMVWRTSTEVTPKEHQNQPRQPQMLRILRKHHNRTALFTEKDSVETVVTVAQPTARDSKPHLDCLVGHASLKMQLHEFNSSFHSTCDTTASPTLVMQ